MSRQCVGMQPLRFRLCGVALSLLVAMAGSMAAPRPAAPRVAAPGLGVLEGDASLYSSSIAFFKGGLSYQALPSNHHPGTISAEWVSGTHTARGMPAWAYFVLLLPAMVLGAIRLT